MGEACAHVCMRVRACVCLGKHFQSRAGAETGDCHRCLDLLLQVPAAPEVGVARAKSGESCQKCF